MESVKPISLQSCLLPEEEHTIYAADFKSAELVVLAVLAKDLKLQEILDSGLDIHSQVAVLIYKLAFIELVTAKQRTAAKAAIFGMIYGQTAYGLSKELDILESEAKKIQDALWSILPGVRKFILAVQQEAIKTHKSLTFHGRERDLSRDLREDYGKALRLAVNHKVQGTAGDLMRLALIELNKDLKSVNGRMLIARHDELIFSVPQTVPVQDVFKMAWDAMVTRNDPAFKMRIALKMGKRWGEDMQPVIPV